MMLDRFCSFIPVLIVFSTAFITKNILLSMLLGIISGSLLLTKSVTISAYTLYHYSFQQITDIDTVMISIFLLCLGGLISLINTYGGAYALTKVIKKRVHSSKGVQYASILVSLCFFFDDFFSTIAASSIMRPVADQFKISRLRLAFLIDSFAAPLTILVPLSSWSAMLIMQIERSGININNPLIIGEPFLVYINTLPFIFYSIINLISVIFIVAFNIPLKRMDQHSLATSDIDGSTDGSIADFLVPLLSLFSSIGVAFLVLSEKSSSCWYSAILNAPIFKILALSNVLALIGSIFYFLIQRKELKSTVTIVWQEGMKPMIGVIMVLIHAWIFSAIIRDLKTGIFIASFLNNYTSPLLLSSACFIVALVTTIMIGSSWSAIGLLAPFMVPLATSDISAIVDYTQVPLLLPLLGALFSGAVAGDHLSPLSSTSLMSATGSGCDVFDHTRSQFFYCIPVIIATFIAFFISSYLSNYGMLFSSLTSIIVGTTISCSVLYLVTKTTLKLYR